MRFFFLVMTIFVFSTYVQTLASDNLVVSKLGDVNLSCGDLSTEAASMRDIVFETQDAKDMSRKTSTGVGIAGAAASALIGTATGGIGLAAAGFLINNEIDSDEENADILQDTAQQRRSLMMGIYNAKGCYGPLDHALVDPDETWSVMNSLTSIETASGEDYWQPRKPRYNQ